MAVQLPDTALWSTATNVLMSAMSIRWRLVPCGLRAMVSLYRILLTVNQRLRLEWTKGHRSRQAGWYQIVFFDESRFILRDHDGRFRVKLNGDPLFLSECVIKPLSSQTFAVMVWSAVSLHDNANCYYLRVISTVTGTSLKCYSSKSFPSFKVSLELSFSRIMCVHMFAKTVQDFCSASHMQLLPWSALFTRYAAYWAHMGFSWSVSRSWSVSCSFKRRTLTALKCNVEFSSTSRHSKCVWLHDTLHNNTYCSA